MAKNRYQRQDRRKRAPSDQTDLGAGLVRSANGITVAAWSLPEPRIEYFADYATVRVLAGTPTFHFFQIHPGGDQILNGVSISMTRSNFENLVGLFDPVLEGIYKQAPQLRELEVPAVPDFASLDNASYKKFGATLSRGGTRDDLGMMDFYRVSLMSEAQLESESDLARGVIRVLMSPETMRHVLVAAKQLELENRS